MDAPNYVLEISQSEGVGCKQVENVLKLIDDMNTVPFIARYRKEATGGLDENKIRAIVDRRDSILKLYDLKVSVIRKISEQGKLTPELQKLIEDANTVREVEDYYEPFKSKKKTKADIALEKGYGVVADEILKKVGRDRVLALVKSKGFDVDSAYAGGCDIVIQGFVNDVDLKNKLRDLVWRFGTISSKYSKHDDLVEKVLKQVHKFEIYSGFGAALGKIKSYQVLALNRGESLGILKVSVDKVDRLFEDFIGNYSEDMFVLPYYECLREAYKKMFTSVSREVRKDLTLRASEDAVVTFKDNLSKLLMIKPEYGKRVLAIDPGYRTGCKVAVLDSETNPIEFGKIFVMSDGERVKGLEVVKSLVSKYHVDVIVIGNGTASNETYDMLNGEVTCSVVVVNESGASVYSASEAGNTEFPSLDATERGTVSIGRRYIDPLAELVKIPPMSIGVGMYQHDVSEKLLSTELSNVIVDIVNQVGVNVNTASVYVLEKISGLTRRSAQKIVDGKPFGSRLALSKVLSKKAFEQASGFLRVPSSSEVFDNTNIHPEQYSLARFVVDKGVSLENYSSFEAECLKLYSDCTLGTVKDILEAYRNKGVEIRKFSGNLKLDKTLSIDDLVIGEKVKGVVRNIMPFGVFVDIGVKNNGLIHISQLADTFVKDPNDFVSIGQEVMVRIVSVEKDTGKIGLSMKEK